MKTRIAPIAKHLSILLSAALVAAGCRPALAAEVEVPAPDDPFVSIGEPGTADFPTLDPVPMPERSPLTAMLYYVPVAPEDGVEAGAPRSASPIDIKGGTGADTQLGVDLSAINSQAEREGWPWYAKAGVVIGCVALVGLATWGIVEASHSGSHDNDSSQHYTIPVGGTGNTVHVDLHPYDSHSSSSSTRTGY